MTGIDERKREEVYAIREVRKTEKIIAEFINDRTRLQPHFPSCPFPTRMVNRHKKDL